LPRIARALDDFDDVGHVLNYLNLPPRGCRRNTRPRDHIPG
jgi:hypothetical protein